MMSDQLVYTPVLRLRQEEQKVLLGFNFNNNIIPYVEIIKELDRLPPTPKKKPKVISLMPQVAKGKSFEEIHIPILKDIKSKHVFVDLPVHMDQRNQTKKVVLNFLRTVVDNRQIRTAYMLKLAPLADKVIPVISTYYLKTNEGDSIKLQATDLRPTFNRLAFRTSFTTLKNDLSGILDCAEPQDYLFVDLEDIPVDIYDEELIIVKELLKTFSTCPIVLLRSALSKDITNKGLDHDDVLPKVDNELMNIYKQLGGHAFADYAGIKKDDVTDGGGISPGFIYYDATRNQYYGYRANDENKKLEDFLDIIIPAVLASEATLRMKNSDQPFLNNENKGWVLIQKMNAEVEPSKSPAKFKRISIEHYLHCIKTRIDNGDYN